MNIINAFLRAKHWQLFLMVIGAPIVMNIIIVVAMLTSGISPNNPDIFSIYNTVIPYFPLVLIITMGGLYGWTWSVVYGLQDKIPYAYRKSLTRFKILFFIPIIYILGLSLLTVGMMLEVIDGNIEGYISIIPLVFVVVIPLHLLSMIGVFHSMYYVAKTIKMAELQKEVKFIDALGEFVLTWFYPIGIWFLQPKINKMIKDDNQETSSFIERH